MGYMSEDVFSLFRPFLLDTECKLLDKLEAVANLRADDPQRFEQELQAVELRRHVAQQYSEIEKTIMEQVQPVPEAKRQPRAKRLWAEALGYVPPPSWIPNPRDWDHPDMQQRREIEERKERLGLNHTHPPAPPQNRLLR